MCLFLRELKVCGRSTFMCRLYFLQMSVLLYTPIVSGFYANTVYTAGTISMQRGSIVSRKEREMAPQAVMMYVA